MKGAAFGSTSGGAAEDWVGCAHAVQFYDDEAVLLDVADRFVGTALGAGEGALVIATGAHRAGLRARLRGRGLDVDGLTRGGRYRELDATRLMHELLVDDWPDVQRFLDALARPIAALRGDGRPPVAVFGEMVHLLWAKGHADAAIRLEQLWNDLAESCGLSLLCGYPMSDFRADARSLGFRRVCAEHARVLPVPDVAAADDPAARGRAIAELQQKAVALDALLDLVERAPGTAEPADRARDEFLAMLGHELRNPLSAVRNALLTARLDPARHERAYDIACRQADQMARMLDQLLESQERRRSLPDGAAGNGALGSSGTAAGQAGVVDPGAPRSRTESGGNGAARVLIVEDNLDAAESLLMLLELLGHQARAAHDGVSAVTAALVSPPDVMLVDIGLPGIDGYEVARRVRARAELADVRLIALTGYGRDEDRDRAVDAGFDHHLVKPIELDALQTLMTPRARRLPPRA